MAVQHLNGSDLLGQRINVDWAFVKPKQERGSRRLVVLYMYCVCIIAFLSVRVCVC